VETDPRLELCIHFGLTGHNMGIQGLILWSLQLVVSIKWEPQVGLIHWSGQRLNLAKKGCSTMAENGTSWE